MENATAVESLAWSDNANELFKVIDLGSTPQAKQELVSKVFANPVLMSKLLRTGVMTRLLDLYDKDDAWLTSLFSNPKELQLVADSANANQIIDPTMPHVNLSGLSEQHPSAVKLVKCKP